MNWTIILLGVTLLVIGAWPKKVETPHVCSLATREAMPKSVLINNTWRVVVDSWEENTSVMHVGTAVGIYGDITNIRAGHPKPDAVLSSPYKGEIITDMEDVHLKKVIADNIGDLYDEDGKPFTFTGSSRDTEPIVRLEPLSDIMDADAAVYPWGCGRELPYTLAGWSYKLTCGKDGNLCPVCRYGHEGYSAWEEKKDD